MIRTCIAVILVIASADTLATTLGCDESGESTLTVVVTRGIEGYADWVPVPGEIHPLTLENGLAIGVEINPAPKRVYQESFDSSDRSTAVELAEILIYDMSGPQPKLLSRTYGGTNSRQGFSDRGGANRIDSFGYPGLNFALYKPHCITRASITGTQD